MKILVIDDNAVNREAAKQTVIGHDLTIVDGWDAAMEVMGVSYDKSAIEAKLVARGLPPTPDALRDTLTKPQMTETDHKTWGDWWDTYSEVQETCRIPYWDAVLTDLLMPASSETMGPAGQKFVGQEMPVGLAIALLAAQNGAKYVAVVTATNHHHHPAVAMLDRVKPRGKPNFVINGAKVMFGVYDGHSVDGISCPKCNGDNPAMSECWTCSKTGKAWGKNWGKTLARLLGEKVAEE